jgi:hypothetical protein
MVSRHRLEPEWKEGGDVWGLGGLRSANHLRRHRRLLLRSETSCLRASGPGATPSRCRCTAGSATWLHHARGSVASTRERTQCNEAHAIQIQHSKRSTKPNLKPTKNSNETMDKPKQSTKQYSLPKKNHGLLYEKPNATELEKIFQFDFRLQKTRMKLTSDP